MKRLLYDVSRWHLFLHREARGLPAAAGDDTARLMLEDELFERLYSGGGDRALTDDASDSWASGIHAACDALPSFKRLSDECRGDEIAAAGAVEVLMKQLAAPEKLQHSTPPKESELRRVIARGCEHASDEVSDFRDALEGLSQVRLPGVGASAGGAKLEGAAARAVAARLRGDPRLQDIARLAGRFKRLLEGKRRQRVRRGADEVTSIEQGAELERLLPVELARLTRPTYRLAFLRDLLERQCAQYALSGQEARGRGPIVVCLDKSSSMSGEPDTFATATALALLDVAQRERRTFGLVCFNGEVCFEAVVRPGEALPVDGLFVRCEGGTSIARALSRGLDIIEGNSGSLRAADIVLITDGESDSAEAPELANRASGLGANVLGFGIGVGKAALEPWCPDPRLVRVLDDLDESALGSLAEL